MNKKQLASYLMNIAHQLDLYKQYDSANEVTRVAKSVIFNETRQAGIMDWYNRGNPEYQKKKTIKHTANHAKKMLYQQMEDLFDNYREIIKSLYFIKGQYDPSLFIVQIYLNSKMQYIHIDTIITMAKSLLKQGADASLQDIKHFASIFGVFCENLGPDNQGFPTKEMYNRGIDTTKMGYTDVRTMFSDLAWKLKIDTIRYINASEKYSEIISSIYSEWPGVQTESGLEGEPEND